MSAKKTSRRHGQRKPPPGPRNRAEARDSRSAGVPSAPRAPQGQDTPAKPQRRPQQARATASLRPGATPAGSGVSSGAARREPARGANPPEAPRSSGARSGDDSWLYGHHAVAAALANPRRRVRRMLALADAAELARGWLAGARARLPEAPLPEIAGREVFETLLPPGAVHQGVALLVAALPPLRLEDVIAARAEPEAPQIVVLLDQVTDPHNIGAVLRSAAAFGATALVVPEHGAPEITGTLAKTASGALEHVPLVRVVNLARSMDQLKAAGYWCIGLDEAADAALGETDLGGKIALVLGAEGDGMRRLTRERCDLLLRLPTRGPIASLNVSNAAAIALYELARRAGSPERTEA